MNVELKRRDECIMCGAKRSKIEKAWKVVEAARALYGDLCAHDEEPSHYVSWSRLRDAIEDLYGSGT